MPARTGSVGARSAYFGAGAILFAISMWTNAQLVAADTPGDDNRRCYNCHGQLHIAELSADERLSMVAATDEAPQTKAGPSARPELFLPPDALASGTHAELSCVSCHVDTATLPHAQQLAPATCTQGCHAASGAAFRRSTHAAALVRGEPLAPTCAHCHGTHDIQASSERQSKTHPLNVIKVCADCHEQHYEPTTHGRNGKEHIQTYLESVHGRALSKGGLAVAATCVSCHQHHEVLPTDDPDGTVSREQVSQTCGRCHVGINETYQTSVHGKKLAEGNPDVPVCTDCHTAHGISRATTPGFMRDIVAECGGCHDQPASSSGGRSLYETYRLSYHGQVTELGSTRAARCSDCHGAHDILPVEDENSRVHASNRLQTCAKCHPDANANFTMFQAHADYRDGQRYPLLHGIWLYFVVLMIATLGFYGVHSLLWLNRSVLDRIKHGRPVRAKPDAYSIRRFNKLDRINHALMAITFFGLALTGMPLFFSDHQWAKTLTTMIGGVHVAGFLHRTFAVVLLANCVAHVVGLVRLARRSSIRALLFGPNTMLPRWQDVIDCIAMFRWFFGGRKPSFDRWTYWEKFDYWAEIVGTCIIGGTGQLLWFPTFFSIFMPGWWFNVATVVHGYEALLAVGFIFTIHFFNAHLRLEKFPVDDVIFTGLVPETEFKHERAIEYERLVATGQLDQLRVPAPPGWQRVAAIIIGMLAMAIGTLIVVLIALAGLELI